MDSPFHSHLNTNHVPTDEQLIAIKQLLDDTQPEITKLDAELARMEQELEGLRRKRSTYDTFLSQHKALVSPIRRIPIDVLNLIFQHCLPTEHNPLLSAAHPPILLTHVCRHWRDTALHNTRLWSSVYIPIPAYPNVHAILTSTAIPIPRGISATIFRGPNGLVLTSEQRQIMDDEAELWEKRIRDRRDLVVEWFRRAGNGSGLRITLAQWDSLHEPNLAPMIGPEDTDPLEHPVVKEIIGLVKAHSRRWEALAITASMAIVRELVSVAAMDAPNLKVLRVGARTNSSFHTPQGPPAEEEPLFPEGSIISAPSLRTLALQTIYEDVCKLPVQWASLTNLVFCGYPTIGPRRQLSFTPTEALELLGMCPNLKQCGLAVGSRVNWGGAPPAPNLEAGSSERGMVVLEHLESMWVHEQPQFPLNDFFQSLEVPKLSAIKFMTTILPTTPPAQGSDTGDTDSNVMAHFGIASQPYRPSSLLVFLRLWGHNIKKLEFDYTYQTSEGLQECLSLVPGVEDLHLSLDARLGMNPAMAMTPRPLIHRSGSVAPAYLGDALFKELLIPKAGGECLCPKMKCFLIRLTTAEISEEGLLEFVKARRSKTTTVAPLKRITVSFAIESRASRARRREARTPPESGEWPLLKSIEDDPDVDLEGFSATVTWPMDPLLRHSMFILGGGGVPQVRESFSPAWGLTRMSQNAAIKRMKDLL